MSDVANRVLDVYSEIVALECEIRVLNKRIESLLRTSADYCDLKGWLRLCGDDEAGHAEFYAWASHYFFGTDEPEDEDE